MTTATTNWRLEATGITKSFGPVHALRGVDLRVASGEALGLLGDNGAGKSTLIKVLTGVHQPDAGTIKWDGREVRFKSPADAIALGIAVAYQDLAIVDQMPIYRNMFLGREEMAGRRFGPLQLFDIDKARELSEKALKDIGLRMTDVSKPVMSLSGGERQSIAIARAVYFQSKLLILDEPTSALSVVESRKVLSYVQSATDAGVAVILISHNLHSVMAVADRVVVLGRGQTVREFPDPAAPESPLPSANEIADVIESTTGL